MHSRPTRRPTLPGRAPGLAPKAAVLLLSCAFLSCLLPSCGPRRRVLVGLDEAFAAARPELARRLSRLSTSRPAAVGLSEGPSRLYEAARAAGVAGPGASGPRVLVASPLLAAALSGSAAGFGPGGAGAEGLLDGALVVAAEWQGPLPEGLLGVSTDYEPAYRAAGRAAGAYVAFLRAAGAAEATGAILFSESAVRPRVLGEAFAEAFEAEAGFPPLSPPLPPAPPAGAAAPQAGPEAEADAALQALLGSDLRILFVAAGPGSAGLCARAARPGLALGAAAPLSGCPEACFSVEPDEAALARAVEDLARGAGLAASRSPQGGAARPAQDGAGDTVSRLVLVPALLGRARSAEGFRAGESSLAALLRRAAGGR